MANRNNPKTKKQTPLLMAKDLRKSYGERMALCELSFSLAPGRILGFLGPNGAGKTTAIRILTTMLAPDSGQFFIAGISSKYPERIRRIIGVLPENLGLPKNMTAIEYLTYFGQLYGQKSAEAKVHGLTLLEEVGLSQRTNSLIDSYSHGMCQRLGIARALINNPVVVFLDEPTLGLDPRGQQELLSLVRQIAKERSASVVMCSHLLWEIEEVCDDVLILKLGRLIETGTVAEVIGRDRSSKGRDKIMPGYGVRIKVPSEAIAKAQKVLKTLSSVIKVDPMGENTGWLQVEFKDTATNKLLTTLIRAEIPILRFEAEGKRLQDVFLHLTEEATR